MWACDRLLCGRGSGLHFECGNRLSRMATISPLPHDMCSPGGQASDPPLQAWAVRISQFSQASKLDEGNHQKSGVRSSGGGAARSFTQLGLGSRRWRARWWIPWWWVPRSRLRLPRSGFRPRVLVGLGVSLVVVLPAAAVLLVLLPECRCLLPECSDLPGTVGDSPDWGGIAASRTWTADSVLAMLLPDSAHFLVSRADLLCIIAEIRRQLEIPRYSLLVSP